MKSIGSTFSIIPMNFGNAATKKPCTAIGAVKSDALPESADAFVRPKRIGVSQGSAAISTDVTPLFSPDHITCYNILIVNLEKRHAYIAHVWEGEYGGFSPRQIHTLDQFQQSLGRKVALMIQGTRSSGGQRSAWDLQKRGIQVLEPLNVESGKNRWDVTFNPETRQVEVIDEDGQKLYSGVPFPPYEPSPPHEAGLSDAERVLLRLNTLMDPNTGELKEGDRLRLKKLLQQREISLIYELMAQRAKAAGYQDYLDYIEANPDHWLNIPAGSPEWTWRKIWGCPPFTPENTSPGAPPVPDTRLTVAALAELLKDHPEILKEWVGD